MSTFRPLWEQPYALTTLLTGLLATLLAMIVVLKAPRSRAARWWGIMCAGVAGWAYVDVLSLLCVRPEDSLWFLRVADAIALFIPVTFLHFAMQFAGRLRPAIVQRIVQDHGGSIAVASPPGRGTTFTVRLPITEPASHAS